MAQLPYTTSTNLKNVLKIAATDTSDDGYLTLIVPRVQAFIDRYTGRSFGWGDVGDSANTDYSNTDNLGIISATISGNNCTFTFYAAAPFVVGSVVVVSGFTPTAINGTWTVTYVSADKTQIAVNLGIGGVQNATIIGTVVSSVSNFKFMQQEAYDGLVGHTFYLMNMDVRHVDALWVGSRSLYPPVLLNPNQYVWREDGRIVLGGSYFNSYNSSNYTGGGSSGDFSGTLGSGYQTITVSYHYGYIGVPPEIAMACEDIISALHKLRLSQGVHMEQAGDYRIQYNDTLRQAMKMCPDSLGVLDMWRRVQI